jgi:hypothetical protein
MARWWWISPFTEWLCGVIVIRLLAGGSPPPSPPHEAGFAGTPDAGEVAQRVGGGVTAPERGQLDPVSDAGEHPR